MYQRAVEPEVLGFSSTEINTMHQAVSTFCVLTYAIEKDLCSDKIQDTLKKAQIRIQNR